VAKILVVAIVLLALAGAADARSGRVGRDPVPLQGIQLQAHTGLRLLVSAKRPFFLDVDAGTVTRVRGVPAKHRFFMTVGVSGRAAVVVGDALSRRGQLYAVRGKRTSLKPLGPGAEVAPAAGGRSVWAKRLLRHSRCTLRQVGLDGVVLRAPKPFRCSRIYSGGKLGLGVSPTRLIDPVTRRTVFRTRLGIVAVAGGTVVLQGHNQFILFDAATGARRRVEWPATDGRLFGAAIDPRGRFVALSFGNPSWTSEGRYPDDQYYDAWVLDTETAELTRLPAMPAFAALKWTSAEWTEDGRLVLLTRGAGKDVVALWRPGQERLALKSMRLQARDNVSNTFAPLG
jgi:hypothetical protein